MTTTEIRKLQAENADLRNRLKQACALAQVLDQRFIRVWRETAKPDVELEIITHGTHTRLFIDRLVDV